MEVNTHTDHCTSLHPPLVVAWCLRSDCQNVPAGDKVPSMTKPELLQWSMNCCRAHWEGCDIAAVRVQGLIPTVARHTQATVSHLLYVMFYCCSVLIQSLYCHLADGNFKQIDHFVEQSDDHKWRINVARGTNATHGHQHIHKPLYKDYRAYRELIPCKKILAGWSVPAQFPLP